VQIDPQCAEHALVDVASIAGMRHGGIGESNRGDSTRLRIDTEQVMVPLRRGEGRETRGERLAGGR
jgi:hypothetical protein